VHSPESANDRVRRRSHVTDASRRDDEVSNRSGRRSVDVPRSEPRPERKQEAMSQGIVERKRGPRVGEKGRESRGRDDERVAAASEPGNGATDQTTSGVSLVKPTSSQDLPEARVDSPPHHHHSESPTPSPTPPTMPSEQTASTSKRSTYQRRRDGHVRVETRRRRRDDDDEWSRERVQSRNRGYRETNDDDGIDVDVHRAYVVPQQPQTVSQMADVEATDTTDPNTTSARPAVPVGTTNEPSNWINDGAEGGNGREVDEDVEIEDEKGGRASESAALSSNDDGGDEDVRHTYVVPEPVPPSPYQVPPPPDESRPPPSVSLEGEMSGKQSSDHADEAATHHEHPRHESTTTPPIRTPRDEKSSGEGRGTAMSHREAAGARDEVGEGNDGRETSYRVEETPNEVEGSDDAASTSYGVDDERSRRGEAKDEMRGDEEGQQTREGERSRTRDPVRPTTATNANEHDQHPSKDEDHSPRPSPQPPPPAFHPPAPTPTLPHPERPDDVDTAKSNKTAAQRMCADALHDPDGQTDAPDSVPPSVRLEGERNRRTSLNVDVDDVETDDDHAEDDDHTQQPSRHPVGTTDGDERRPSEPTEPPDEEEGETAREMSSRGSNRSNRIELRRGGRGVEVERSRGQDRRPERRRHLPTRWPNERHGRRSEQHQLRVGTKRAR
jgi:hypothetical protein